MDKEEVKEEKQEETKEDVKEAFGNNTESPAENKADPKATDQEETDQKQEGTVSAGEEKKQSDNKTYTQAEVDAMMAKARKKYTGKTNETDQVTETTNVEDTAPAYETQTQDLATGLTVERYAQAELKASMAIAGVDPQKVQRAVRLIDASSVIENGQYSEEKAKQEIEALLQDWPELKETKSEANSNAFYFGAPEQEEQSQEEKQKGMFSSIFGNKKGE